TRHRADITSSSAAAARLTPGGWRDNTIGSLDRSATRQSMGVAWNRSGLAWAGRHALTAAGDWQARAMRGVVDQTSVHVEDAGGRLMRSIDFGRGRAFERRDAIGDVLVRDAWDVQRHVQLDVGARVDWYNREPVVSPRLGVRAALDAGEATVVKACSGRCVGRWLLG